MRISIVLLLIICLTTACREQINRIVVLPGTVVTENYIGNGVQWDAYPHADSENAEWGLLMTDEKWQMVFDRLDYMQPRLVRSLDQANWRYLKGFDKDGKPIINFDNPEEKALEKLLNYCQKNDVTVLLGEWGCPFQVHDKDKGFSGVLKGANDRVWINIIVQHLTYLIKEKGFTCIKYFNLVNEPNGYWASTDGDWQEWSDGAKMLSAAIDSAGLSSFVSIAGPDAVAHYDHPEGKLTGMQWVEESAKTLKNELGALELHAYFQPSIIRNATFECLYKPLVDIARQNGKPIFFGEVGFDKGSPENEARIKTDPHTSPDSYMGVYDYQHGIDMADAAIQIMASGFNGAAAWDLDDAMHTNNDSGDRSGLKRWGMWNTLGTELCHNPADEKIRPWFFTWSLMCRYIKQGSKIVKVDASEGLRATAAVYNNDITLAIVNQTDNVISVWVEIPKKFSDKVLKLFAYEENNFLTDSNGFPVTSDENVKLVDGKIELKFPAKSFKLITSFNY